MAAAEPLEDGNVLQSFWGLASTDDKERIDSARDLLTALSNKQEEIGEEAVAPDIRYSLQRLVRGLASGRKRARQGFFVALTELLAMCEEVTVEEVLKLVDTHLQPHKGIRGTEEKGVYFGRFFALSAIFLSGRLTLEEEVLEVTRQFGAIAAKKSFMSEMCAVAIGNLVENARFHSNGGGDLRLEVVREGWGGVGEGWLGCTPERLYLVLRLDKILRGESWWAELIRSKWSDADYDIITSSQLDSVASILEASCGSRSGLHSVWPRVIDVVRDTPLFHQFWQKIVEETLLSSTHKKQLVALNVLESLIMPTITEYEVAVVFSAGIVRRILNNAASPSSPLHASIQKLLTTVSSADKPVDTRVALFVHIQYRSGGRFDALTKTETTRRLLSSLDRGGVDRLISKLEEIFRSPEILSVHYDSDDPLSEPHMVQTWVGDQFLAIVKNKSLPKSSNSLLDVAKLLLCHAHYSSSSDQLQIAAVEPQVQRLCSTRLMGVLAELCTLTTPTKPTKKGEGEERKRQRQPGRMEETGWHYLVSLVLYAQQLPSHPLQNKALAAWEYVGSVLSEMEERGDGGLQLEESAFQLLFAAVGLELLRDPQSATETVEDLRQCYEDMKQEMVKQAKPQTNETPRKKKAEEKKEEDDESESSAGWVEVLVDLLLGLESRQSQLWRSVVEQVFRGIVHRITPGAVQLIANVLRPQKKEELMEKEGESEEERRRRRRRRVGQKKKLILNSEKT
ncbi:rDNA transcriptional regulator pol5 [Geodia barretti]|uniref:rDNA transcriptional regulator pol5 n=1 Tax=Geodia barretti TaxID=519541 RepID=A0AA35SJP1_GEOBA|nr:rDNA transcriptional regulator pol5 [Geodia barretti]